MLEQYTFSDYMRLLLFSYLCVCMKAKGFIANKANENNASVFKCLTQVHALKRLFSQTIKIFRNLT